MSEIMNSFNFFIKAGNQGIRKELKAVIYITLKSAIAHNITNGIRSINKFPFQGKFHPTSRTFIRAAPETKSDAGPCKFLTAGNLNSFFYYFINLLGLPCRRFFFFILTGDKGNKNEQENEFLHIRRLNSKVINYFFQ